MGTTANSHRPLPHIIPLAIGYVPPDVCAHMCCYLHACGWSLRGPFGAEWALRISGATMGQSSPCNHGPTQPLQPWAKAAPWARAAMGHLSGPLQPWAKAAPRLQGQSKQPQGWQGTAAPLPCHHRKNKNVARVQTAEGTQRADRADSRGQMARVGQTAGVEQRAEQRADGKSRADNGGRAEGTAEGRQQE